MKNFLQKSVQKIRGADGGMGGREVAGKGVVQGDVAHVIDGVQAVEDTLKIDAARLVEGRKVDGTVPRTHVVMGMSPWGSGT